MKEQRLIKKVEDQAKRFKSRALKSPDDLKRHDQVHRDEQRWMYTAHKQLGWSFAKIGSVFNRDPRTTKQAVESYKAIRDRAESNLTEAQVGQQAGAREKLVAQQLIQQWREQAEFLSIDQFLRKLYLETRHTDLAYEYTEPEQVRQAYFHTFGRHWETMPRPYKAMLPVESESLFEHLKRLHPDAEVWQAQESWSEAYGTYWDAFCSWIVEVEYDSELLMGAAVDESTSAGLGSKVANAQRLIKEIKRVKPDVWLFLRLLALTVACDLLLSAMGEQPAHVTWALEVVKIRKLRQDVVFVSMKELPKHFWLTGTNRVYPVAKSLWDRYQLVKEKTTTLLKALERLQTAQSNLHQKLKILEHSLL